MTLSRLIKSYIDNKDPSCAVSNMLHLIDLIIMSNHLTEGHLIASALYRLVENFHTNAKGEHLDFSIIIPDTLNIFWHEHQETFPRPKRTPPGYSNPPDEKWLLKMYWDKYRECTRTGWMLDHFGLAEPDNPYAIWRETDDPNMLAMCARLLAKTTTRGTYPSDNRAREALGAALKLYAIPEVPLAELLKKGIRTRSHSQLIYRRLAVELAIRLGELQTAADIISQEMRQDASSGSYATGFLIVPGIYDVLPLLASGGKESNPCYITKDEAVVVTREIIAALESRAAHGRQWELHPSKVGWRELLDRLSEGAWKAHNKECRAMGLKGPQDILFEPATEEEIAAAEEKFGELPADLKEMVRLSNG